MIVGNQSQEIVNNLPFASKTFSISANAKAFDMLIAQLYSDLATAMIREIVANACDSHRSAETNAKVIVRIPNVLEPWFVVQDFGLGMSEETIDTIYTNVFESTKDQDNESTGGFGLGSKTPYAVTDTFNVATVKDGIKCEFLMYRDGNRNPAYMLTSKTETDEPNGVKVSVPFNGKFCSYDEFKQKAITVLSRFDFEFDCNIEFKKCRETWLETPVPNVYVDTIQRGTSVLMAGILYPLNEDISPLYRHTIVEIPNGSVELTPSREQLFYSQKTKDYIASLKPSLNEAEKAIKEKFSKITKLKERIEFYNKWGGVVSISDPNYFEVHTKNSFSYFDGRYYRLLPKGTRDYYRNLKDALGYTRISYEDIGLLKSNMVEKMKAAGVLPNLICITDADYEYIYKIVYGKKPDSVPDTVRYEDVVVQYKAALKALRAAQVNIVSKKTDGHFWILVNGKAEFIQVNELQDDDIVLIPYETHNSRLMTREMTKYTQGTRIDFVQKVLGKRVVYARTVLARTIASEHKTMEEFITENESKINALFGAACLSDLMPDINSYRMAKRQWLIESPVHKIVEKMDTSLLYLNEIKTLEYAICEMKASLRLMQHYGYEYTYQIPSKLKIREEYHNLFNIIQRTKRNSLTGDPRIDNFILDGDY